MQYQPHINDGNLRDERVGEREPAFRRTIANACTVGSCPLAAHY